MKIPDQPQPDDRRCGAKTRAGTPCQVRPLRGATRCRLHGGASPRSLAAAARRLEEIEAVNAVARLGGRRDIAPGQALLELVQTKAAEVVYWQTRVGQIEEENLLWGLTKTSTESGAVQESKPHAALVQLHEAQRDLAAYAAAALKAGVEERAIRLAEGTARQVAAVLTTALADHRLGVTLTDDTRRLIIADAIKELNT